MSSEVQEGYVKYDLCAGFTYALHVIELLHQPVTLSTDNILWELRNPSEAEMKNQSNLSKGTKCKNTNAPEDLVTWIYPKIRV